MIEIKHYEKSRELLNIYDISTLIHDKQVVFLEFFEVVFQQPFITCFGEGIDQVGCTGKKHLVSPAASFHSKGNRRMGFSRAMFPNQNDILMAFDVFTGRVFTDI